MVAYLSDEWVEALDAALAAPPPPPAAAAAAATAAVTVQYRVIGGPDGDRCWHLDLAPDRLEARVGEADDPLVTFSQRWAVATAIAGGRRSAAEALLAGDISVSGRSAELVPWRAALRQADAALAELAAITEVPAPAGHGEDR